jgi:predicted  nucleic acid-binding Zn-ribbon protein
MAAKKELTIADKLDQLLQLQKIHSKIDEIRVLKGELPIEVADLEDEVAGLETRHNKFLRDIEGLNDEITEKKQRIKDAQAMILKYERQLDLVKNNREFDAISKEIELCKLDIELAEKKIRQANEKIVEFQKLADDVKAHIDQKMIALEEKRKELGHIIQETEKEENELLAKAEELAVKIEDRLLTAYNRIRNNYKNGLAVVLVERDACGGCFGRIPPQTQAEIKLKKKIMICEHCGRILADVAEIADEFEDAVAVSAE